MGRKGFKCHRSWQEVNAIVFRCWSFQRSLHRYSLSQDQNTRASESEQTGYTLEMTAVQQKLGSVTISLGPVTSILGQRTGLEQAVTGNSVHWDTDVKGANLLVTSEQNHTV